MYWRFQSYTGEIRLVLEISVLYMEISFLYLRYESCTEDFSLVLEILVLYWRIQSCTEGFSLLLEVLVFYTMEISVLFWRFPFYRRFQTCAVDFSPVPEISVFYRSFKSCSLDFLHRRFQSGTKFSVVYWRFQSCTGDFSLELGV